MNNCVICCSVIPPSDLGAAELRHINCPRCGEYRQSPFPLQTDSWNALQRTNAIGYLREYPGFLVDAESVSFLSELRTPAVGEKALKLFRFFVRHFPEPGRPLLLPRSGVQHQDYAKGEVPPVTWDHMQAACWAANPEELHFLQHRVLTEELRYLEKPNGYLITPRGWAAIEESNRNPGTIESECFVAMWFDDKMDPLLQDVIIPGTRAAGYESRCLKTAHHNNNIHDEILAGVRRAKFVIADFTAQRGGVYFEAGFALGLGKQVIYLVRKGERQEVHFDNQQYNFIEWSPDNLPEARQRLQNRIEGTLGRGPLPPQ